MIAISGSANYYNTTCAQVHTCTQRSAPLSTITITITNMSRHTAECCVWGEIAGSESAAWCAARSLGDGHKWARCHWESGSIESFRAQLHRQRSTAWSGASRRDACQLDGFDVNANLLQATLAAGVPATWSGPAMKNDQSYAFEYVLCLCPIFLFIFRPLYSHMAFDKVYFICT